MLLIHLRRLINLAKANERTMLIFFRSWKTSDMNARRVQSTMLRRPLGFMAQEALSLLDMDMSGNL